MDARFELLDGDTEVLPGLEVITTPATRPAISASWCAVTPLAPERVHFCHHTDVIGR